MAKTSFSKTEKCSTLELGALQFFPALRDDLEEANQLKCDQILTQLENYRDFELSTISNQSTNQNSNSTVQSEAFDFGDLAAKLNEKSQESAPRSAYFLGMDRPQKKVDYPEWFTFCHFPWQAGILRTLQSNRFVRSKISFFEAKRTN